jgi:uncharacterized membrane protein YdbT with pleckstrin-like domain
MTSIRPAWRSYWTLWLFCWLVLPLLVIVWRRCSVRLVIGDETVSLEEGLLGTTSTEILIRNIRTVEVRRSLVDRILGVGTLLIGASATEGYEIVVSGLPDPEAVRERLR